MEAALLGSILNTLVPRILEAGQSRARAQAQLELDIINLRKELPMMADTVDAYESLGMNMEVSHIKFISNARRWAQDLADNIELFYHPSASLMPYERFERSIQDLKTRLMGITVDKSIPHLPVEEAVDQSIPRLPVIPKDETLKELLHLVKEFAGKPEGKVKVISIVGFSGLGKTLRANQLYRSEEVPFQRRAWVCAQGMNEHKLIKVIREALENSSSSSNDPQQVSNGAIPSTVVQSDNHGGRLSDNERIAKCLEETRCFIVIDDMRRPEQWDRIRLALPEKAGSMIVVTTTIQPVAEACRSSSGGYVYKLPNLTMEMSIGWLVKEFPLEKSATVKVYAKKLLNKCDGLPLALDSLCKYFQRNGKGLKRDSCEVVCKHLGAYLNGVDQKLPRMTPMLLDKYSGLSGLPHGHFRKACFLYFSLFPFNHPTKRNTLIRRWVAEGFGSRDEAVEHFNTLIDRNIIQAVEVSSNGEAKRCQPPGMMLEYISYKALSQDFASLFHGQNKDMASGFTMVRRVSHNVNSDDNRISCIQLPLVRTLEVSGETCGSLLNNKRIKDKHDYMLLRVLDLKLCTDLTNDDLKCICKHFCLLRYLSLGDSINEVPKEIKHLKLLETLDMTMNKIVEVPFELILLPLLQTLLGKFQFYKDEYKNRIRYHIALDIKESKLARTKPLYIASKLERLSGFVTGQEGFPELMYHLWHLRKVKIWYQSSADKTLMKAIKAFIRVTEPNEGDRLLSVDFTGCSSPFKQLDSYPGWLTSLKLKGSLTEFPQFNELHRVEKLCLSSTKLKWVQIKDALAQFPGLIYLKLYEDDLDNLAPKPEDDLDNLAPKPEDDLDNLAQEAEGSQNKSSDVASEEAGFDILQQICFSGKSGLPPSGIIQDLPKLTHVYLYSGAILNEKITRKWKEAAREHPNMPTVWYGAPPLAETRSQ